VIQVLVGIVLGPSLFGRLFPALAADIFRPDTIAPLTGLAFVAVLLFSFVTGKHLDLSRLKGRASALGVIAGSSLIVPFAAGCTGGPGSPVGTKPRHTRLRS
jgi:Kef-type K+ transport system membrane component KefB